MVLNIPPTPFGHFPQPFHTGHFFPRAFPPKVTSPPPPPPAVMPLQLPLPLPLSIQIPPRASSPYQTLGHLPPGHSLYPSPNPRNPYFPPFCFLGHSFFSLKFEQPMIVLYSYCECVYLITYNNILLKPNSRPYCAECINLVSTYFISNENGSGKTKMRHKPYPKVSIK